MAVTNDLKAEFGAAYVRAVAHAAGYFVDEASRMLDADGVDLTVFARGGGGVVSSPRISIQVKATASAAAGDPFPFDLPVKNYNDLRDVNLQVPCILVVVLVPMDISNWTVGTEQELILRHSVTLREAVQW